MFSEIIAAIFSIFIIEPMQAEIADRVAAAKAPAEIVRASQECLATQAPRLIDRATNDMGWALSYTVRVSLGWNNPLDLLDTSAPGCAALVNTLKQNGEDSAV
ncbi:hypothetical protein O8B93_25070 [Agrobacterium rhizogenes]|uniref:hypothetical protein n=1 Tax=Rhizobium rhizogenes TaxID=359 RepID=UPI0022B60A73|nr:hypothetical protein [Rhizobium rhizogenes]MCZ7450854.1 hypothetical protein [Rhizobium rhizogenes]